MIIDTSAIVAILQNEPERTSFTRALADAESCSISAATLVELSIVIEHRFGPDGVRDLDLLLAKAAVQVVSVDEEQALLARRAFRKFGKGRHRAKLNFGDCFAYALAKHQDEPLLCKGDDFPLTDLALVFPATGKATE